MASLGYWPERLKRSFKSTNNPRIHYFQKGKENNVKMYHTPSHQPCHTPTIHSAVPHTMVPTCPCNAPTMPPYVPPPGPTAARLLVLMFTFHRWDQGA